MGKPVIAAGTGGGTEIIEHGVTGLLFDARDPETLARCIRDLMGNEELAARLARAGRGRALDAFSPPRVAEQYAQLYGELVTGRGRKRVS
jgi:glycosyltransferase involved in cell wall biosynthesis